MHIPIEVKAIMDKLESNGFVAYVIGGAVRDHILGLEPHDYDVFTNATGEQILSLFPAGKVIGNEERQAKILTVVIDGIEVSQFRSNGDRTEVGNDLLTHQSTCDFTINAIACDKNGNIDYTNKNNHIGHCDAKSKRVIFVGDMEKRITEDPLRILRYVRFNSRFGNNTTPELLSYLPLLDTLPKERISEELIKILRYDKGMVNLFYSGVLVKILPEFQKVVNMPGGDHHEETVDQHMFNAFSVACQITDKWQVRLAAFLHDIGKGQCYTKDPEIHFYEHEKIGADYVEAWMKEYKFSKEDTTFVTTLIRYHMWTYKNDISKKGYLRMFDTFNKAGINIMDFVMIVYCDHQANMQKVTIQFGDFVKGSFVLQKYYECVYSKEPFNKSGLALQGGEIIKLLNREPGKWVSELMDKMFDAVCDGTLVNDRIAMIQWVKEYDITGSGI